MTGPDGVGPTEDGLELGRGLPLAQRDLAQHHGAVRPVDRDPVALVDHGVAHGERASRDAHLLGADDGRLAPAPGDHGSVTDQPAPSGEDALGGQHAVHVLG